MRTETRTLYRITELSDEAKEKALNKLRETQDYPWMDEGLDSIKYGVEHFGASLDDWDIDVLNGKADVRLTAPEIHRDEMRELVKAMGDYDPETLRGYGSCAFTGYTMDDEFADEVRAEFFKERFETDEDGYLPENEVRDILKQGIKNAVQAMQRDYEWMLSDEGLTEIAEALEFDEEGNLV